MESYDIAINGESHSDQCNHTTSSDVWIEKKSSSLQSIALDSIFSVWFFSSPLNEMQNKVLRSHFHGWVLSVKYSVKVFSRKVPSFIALTWGGDLVYNAWYCIYPIKLASLPLSDWVLRAIPAPLITSARSNEHCILSIWVFGIENPDGKYNKISLTPPNTHTSPKSQLLIFQYNEKRGRLAQQLGHNEG